MPNAFVNVSWVPMEILRLLINKLHIAQIFSTKWNSEFNREFAVSDTVTLKKPQRFVIREGLAYTPQPLARQTTTITLDQIFGIDFEWDDYEKAVYLERSAAELRANYLGPAASKLANEVDRRAALWAYRNTPNVFGTLAADPTTATPFLAAEQRLFEKACPEDARKLMILSGPMHSAFVGAQAVQFNPGPEIARQYKTGLVGVAHGWEWYRSNNLYKHTAGTWAGAVNITGANQSGSSLIITGTAGDTLFKGDVFSVANVNFTNPNNLQDMGSVQHFVVKDDYVLTAGPDTISIFPAIVGPGSPYQNVSALPTNLAALTLWPGTTTPSGLAGRQGLGLTKEAFGIVGAKFAMPKNVEGSMARDPSTGFAVRFTRWWEGDEAKYKSRFDMCIGFGNLYPDECAVRVVGL